MNADNDNADSALLPTGMSDSLPPDAAFEANVVESLMQMFAAHGFDRVKPPLLEFEDTLFRGPGAATANGAFRLMDPESQRMMALRADMTPQIARIAMSRLCNAPRPLRLSYAGQILRVRGSQLRGARQFGQVGAEIIGSDSRVADAEVVLMAAEALTALGIDGLSVDLCISTLVPAACQDFGFDTAIENRLAPALDRKDAAGIAALRGELGDQATELFTGLLASTGKASDMLQRLETLPFGPAAACERDDLATVAGAIMQAAPDLEVTIDPIERRGWEYHCGVSFTLFAKGARGELGAGGRYLTGDETSGRTREPATGLTLFTDTLVQAVSQSDPAPRIYMPLGVDALLAKEYREQGWVTVCGLEPHDDIASEAARLGLQPRARGWRSETSFTVRIVPGRRATGRTSRWQTLWWSVPSGATKAKARSSTGCRNEPTWWFAFRVATTQVIPWLSATSPTSSPCCRPESCVRANCRSSETASSSIRGH